jgi:hypothetical protein
MRKGILLIGLMAATAFAAGPAWAAFPFPVKGAKLFKASFAHAVTPCDPETGVTLHIQGGIKGGKRDMIGCKAVIPDPSVYDSAQIAVSAKAGKYVLTGKGFAVAKVALQMHVMTTTPGLPKIWETPNTYDVTYLPLHLLCAPATITGGKLVQKGNLDLCVRNPTSSAWNLLKPKTEIDPAGKDNKPSTLNIEILDAEIGTDALCDGGSKNAVACATTCSGTVCQNGDNICIGSGTCVSGLCVGGPEDGEACSADNKCPVDQSTCELTPFGAAGITR